MHPGEEDGGIPLATPVKSQDYPNLRILPFPKKWQDAVWNLRYAGGLSACLGNSRCCKAMPCPAHLMRWYAADSCDRGTDLCQYENTLTLL